MIKCSFTSCNLSQSGIECKIKCNDDDNDDLLLIRLVSSCNDGSTIFYTGRRRNDELSVRKLPSKALSIEE